MQYQDWIVSHCFICAMFFSHFFFWLWIILPLLSARIQKYKKHEIFLTALWGKANSNVETLTEQRDLLGDSVDVDDGPQRAADAESTVEKDGLSFVDAVENSPVAVGPEGQHVVFQGESLGQGLGPVAGPCHQIRAGVLGDVCGHQFAGVQAGEAEA